jgi:hypothetical protein
MKNQMIKITQNFKLLFPWAFFKIQNIKGKKKTTKKVNDDPPPPRNERSKLSKLTTMFLFVC